MEPDQESAARPDIAAKSDLTDRKIWTLTRKRVYICRIIWQQSAIDSPRLNDTSSSASLPSKSPTQNDSGPSNYVSINLLVGSSQVVRLSVRTKPARRHGDDHADPAHWFLELLDYADFTAPSSSSHHHFRDVRVRNCPDDFDPTSPLVKSKSKPPAKIVADWLAAINDTSTTRVRLTRVDGEEVGWRYLVLAVMNRMKDQNAFHPDDASLTHLHAALQQSQTNAHHSFSNTTSDPTSCTFIPALRALKRKPFTAADLAACAHAAPLHAVRTLAESVMRVAQLDSDHDPSDLELAELISLLSSTSIQRTTTTAGSTSTTTSSTTTHSKSTSGSGSSLQDSSSPSDPDALITEFLHSSSSSSYITARAREFAKDLSLQAHAKSLIFINTTPNSNSNSSSTASSSAPTSSVASAAATTTPTLLADFASALDARQYTSAAATLRAAANRSERQHRQRRSSVSEISARLRSLSRSKTTDENESRSTTTTAAAAAAAVGESETERKKTSESARKTSRRMSWTDWFRRDGGAHGDKEEEAERFVLLLAAVVAMDGCPDGD